MREAHPSYKSALRYNFVDDRRDHPLLPTQGTYFSVRLLCFFVCWLVGWAMCALHHFIHQHTGMGIPHPTPPT